MEKTETKYKQLSAEERATIMLMTREGKGVREVGRFLNRSPSTISREAGRKMEPENGYDATLAGEQAACLRIKPRKALKLFVGGELFGVELGISRKNGRRSKLQAHSKVCIQTNRQNE